MNKKDLSERDICTKYITPALVATGWDVQLHIREEVFFTKGRVIVRGKMTARGEAKRADYILYHPSGVPLALIEAKDNHHTVGAGMQQALGYAETLQVPFAFSSNGDAFLFHDRTIAEGEIEKEIPLKEFPSLRIIALRKSTADFSFFCSETPISKRMKRPRLNRSSLVPKYIP
jgi:type I restriction enzyme R subunit